MPRPRALLLPLIILCAGQLLAGPAAAQITVDIRGLSDAMRDNARAYLSIELHKADKSLTEHEIAALHHKATGEISKALQPFGYYHPSIEATLTQENGTWRATYAVDPGPPVTIKSLDLTLEGSGTEDPEFVRLTREFPLRTGDILNHDLYEKGKQSLHNLAAERGYFNFEISTHEVRVHQTDNTASIIIHVNTGPRHHFGDAVFAQDVLKAGLLDKFVPFKRGEPYSSSKLFELQTGLFDSEYFANVDVIPRPEAAVDLEVPIAIGLTPRAQHQYTAGIGYGTDTGARGRLGWENRRVNNRGHRLLTEFKTSEIQDSYGARYSLPIRDPRTDQLVFTTRWTEDHPDTSSSQLFLLGVSQVINRGSGWLQSIYINYERETFDVALDTGTTSLILPGISWTKVTADDRIFTRSGSRMYFDIRGTHTDIGSDTQFMQFRTQGKLIRPIFSRGRVILRGEAGMSRFGEIRELPPSLRFFTGGDQSVRGYVYNTLAPRDENGLLVGGEQLLVGSMEYEQLLFKKFSGAVFFDQGNALNDWQEALKQGAGFGFRWRSPIGQIRTDFAWAISEPGSPQRFHLNIGPDL